MNQGKINLRIQSRERHQPLVRKCGRVQPRHENTVTEIDRNDQFCQVFTPHLVPLKTRAGQRFGKPHALIIDPTFKSPDPRQSPIVFKVMQFFRGTTTEESIAVRQSNVRVDLGRRP
jgi:hypothetical protein